MQLTGNTILVTGGASGIGTGFAGGAALGRSQDNGRIPFARPSPAR